MPPTLNFNPVSANSAPRRQTSMHPLSVATSICCPCRMCDHAGHLSCSVPSQHQEPTRADANRRLSFTNIHTKRKGTKYVSVYTGCTPLGIRAVFDRSRTVCSCSSIKPSPTYNIILYIGDVPNRDMLRKVHLSRKTLRKMNLNRGESRRMNLNRGELRKMNLNREKL